MTAGAVIRWTARGLLAIGIATVTWLSLAPADRLPAPGVSDKVEHLAAYLVLGTVAALAQRRSRVVLTIGLLSLLGLILEIVQGRTGRDFDLRDLAADALGAAIGVLAVALVRAVVDVRPGQTAAGRFDSARD